MFYAISVPFLYILSMSSLTENDNRLILLTLRFDSLHNNSNSSLEKLIL